MGEGVSREAATFDIIETIGFPMDGEFVASVEADENQYEYAKQNKVGNLYRWRIEQAEQRGEKNGRADVPSSEQFEELRETVSRVAALFADEQLQFAFVKTPTAFPADFSDIDILVEKGSLEYVRDLLRDAGYTRLANSPSSTDFQDPETGVTVDVQDDFTLRELVYFPGEAVLHRSREKTGFDSSVRVPSDPAQLALIIIHSLTEQLFTLRDFYHILYLFDQLSPEDTDEFRAIVDEFGLAGAINATLPLVSKLSVEVFDRQPQQLAEIVDECQDYGEFTVLKRRHWETPHRYTGRTMVRVLAHKCKDETFRHSLWDEVKELRDPRVVKSNLEQLVYRQYRDTY
jgi:hypothetical protein